MFLKGGIWPQTLLLYLVDFLSIKNCFYRSTNIYSNQTKLGDDGLILNATCHSELESRVI